MTVGHTGGQHQTMPFGLPSLTPLCSNRPHLLHKTNCHGVFHQPPKRGSSLDCCPEGLSYRNPKYEHIFVILGLFAENLFE